MPTIAVLGLAFMILTISKTYVVRWFFEPHFSESYQSYFNQL
jgi:hypothetical protein